MRTNITKASMELFQSPKKTFNARPIQDNMTCSASHRLVAFVKEKGTWVSGKAPLKWYWCASGISKARTRHAWTITKRTMDSLIRLLIYCIDLIVIVAASKKKSAFLRIVCAFMNRNLPWSSSRARIYILLDTYRQPIFLRHNYY